MGAIYQSRDERIYSIKINFSLNIIPVRKVSKHYGCSTVKTTTFEYSKKSSDYTFFAKVERQIELTTQVIHSNRL